MPDVTRLAFFGGVYSNSRALAAAIADARRWGAEGLYALGDFGAFGPHPDRVFPILLEAGVEAIQGNYEESLSTGAEDCHCGYTDPRDNHFARSPTTTPPRGRLPNGSAGWRRCPKTRRLETGGRRILLVHGSPRKINEFLWESTSPVAFLEKLLAEHDADVLVCTHTGLHWQRRLPSGRLVVNCGALGRPANDGRTERLVRAGWRSGKRLAPSFRPWLTTSRPWRGRWSEEKLPAEFVETIRTGWWTTCLEILPSKERSRGRY